MKPMLASDYNESRLVFPLMAQPKIDGVRALNMGNGFTGRSLKPFKNRFTTEVFSHNGLEGMDGELAAERENHPDLCRLTSSATGTIAGQPYLLWWLFDYVTPATKDLPYFHRFAVLLPERFEDLRKSDPLLWPRLRLMPYKVVTSLEMLLEYENEMLAAGFEGVILRSLKAKHKQGRSTAIEGGLLRIKRFVDFEFKVHAIIEGDANENVAQINELGHTFRSSHQENKVPNGMVGSMLGTMLAVVKDPTTGAVLFDKGDTVQVSAGCLSHAQRIYYFQEPEAFKALIHKGKFFPKGIKDKPRFPTWQTFRDPADIS